MVGTLGIGSSMYPIRVALKFVRVQQLRQIVWVIGGFCAQVDFPNLRS